MLDHDTILGYLSDAFGGRYGDSNEPVSLVARYAEPGLSLPAGRAQIFVPDVHLLSRRDAPAYPKWGFVQDEDLLVCLSALTKLKDDHPKQLLVWQLGDLFDVWRARAGENDADALRTIAADHADIVDCLRYGPPYGVRAEFIAGNHDFALFESAKWKAARYRIIESQDEDGGDILVLHGDLFDWIEGFPDGIQAAVVRFVTWHASGGHELYHHDAATVATANREVATGDLPIGEGEAELEAVASGSGYDSAEHYNVIQGKRGAPNAKKKRFFAAAMVLAKEMRERGYDIRLVVIGHTHWGRIVAGTDDQKHPFALVDAGAWIGRCRLSPDEPWLHNAQVAVVVGNDVRVYQLGWRRVQ